MKQVSVENDQQKYQELSDIEDLTELGRPRLFGVFPAEEVDGLGEGCGMRPKVIDSHAKKR